MLRKLFNMSEEKPAATPAETSATEATAAPAVETTTTPATEETAAKAEEAKTTEDPAAASNAASDTAAATTAAAAADPAAKTEPKDTSDKKDPPFTLEPTPRNMSKSSAAKKKEPKTYGPVILAPNEMDVLSGRGAAVNNHPGNKKFRALCFVRKAHFDLGNHAAKRQLATEIVEILQCGADHPPSRFLKKRPAHALPAPTAEELEAATQTNGGASVLYYAMTKEQAILKAQQVMRDYKRPDRLEAKMLQQQAAQARYDGTDGGAANGVNVPKPHRARATPSTPLDVVAQLDAPDVTKDTLFQVNPFGVHAHDVLSGRGAYVNGHVGNARLRKLATDRKAQFDSGNYTEKRALATEIVTIIKGLEPPGRFLKKASPAAIEAVAAAKAAEAAAAAVKEDGKTEDEPKAAENKDAPKDDAAAAASTEAASAEKKDGEAAKTEDAAKPTADKYAPPPPTLIDGIWEELTDDKAVHKACQVMRDISRPDRCVSKLCNV